MRSLKVLMIAALVVGLAGASYAELQNVLVGGSIRIRGNYYDPASAPDGITLRNPLVDPIWYYGAGLPNPAAGVRSPFFPFRALGTARVGGLIGSAFSFEDEGESLKWIEQRTRLNVRADFTNDVSAFIELDSYDIWGEDFRANYITATDARAASVNDVEVYQAYIEANEMFGYPVRMRVGRQEIMLGSEWLVGNADTAARFVGLSFDGLRLTYDTDMFSVDAIYAKLAENTPLEEDGDVDMYALYGSYKGIEDITLDAYWLFVDDGRALVDTQLGIFGEWVEDLFDADNYDTTTLHTVGLRGAGTWGAFDFEAEVAYQFGEAAQVGFLFPPNRVVGILYGDDSADFDALGANIEVGYTFDMAWTPRVYLGFAWLDGEDNRDITFGEWLWAQINPFYQADASVSFNRLFSDWEYSEFIENGDLSNVWIARGGVSVNPTEDVEVLLAVSYFEAIEEFEDTWPDYFILGNRVTWFAPFSWITETNDSTLGIEVGLYATYNYSEDLTFRAGWAHLFVDEGLEDGNFVRNNGLGFIGGTSDDDPDYLFVETEISF